MSKAELLMQEGYPGWVLLAVLAAGGMLGFFSRRWLFFFVVAGLLLTDLPAYTYCRMDRTGPYLNLLDVLWLEGVAAGLLARGGNLREIPAFWYVSLFLIGFGCALTWDAVGIHTETLRSFRVSLTLPLAWFVAQRGLRDPADARVFLRLVQWACLIQSIRQCVYVLNFPVNDPAEWRTIRFLNAGYPVVSLCFLVFPLTRNRLEGAFNTFCAGVGTIALILNQTRSIWIPQAVIVLGGMVVLLLSRRAHRALAGFMAFIGLAVCVAGFTELTGSHVDLVDLFIHGRATELYSPSTEWRLAAAQAEYAAWTQGNLLWGRGLAFQYSPVIFYRVESGWGHNGYAAYLSNLGILGLVVFGICVPLLALRNARRLLPSPVPETALFGCLTGVVTLQLILMCALTPGLLSGTPYALFAFLLGGSGSLVRASRSAGPDPVPSTPAAAVPT